MDTLFELQVKDLKHQRIKTVLGRNNSFFGRKVVYYDFQISEYLMVYMQPYVDVIYGKTIPDEPDYTYVIPIFQAAWDNNYKNQTSTNYLQEFLGIFERRGKELLPCNSIELGGQSISIGSFCFEGFSRCSAPVEISWARGEKSNVGYINALYSSGVDDLKRFISICKHANSAEEMRHFLKYGFDESKNISFKESREMWRDENNALRKKISELEAKVRGKK